MKYYFVINPMAGENNSEEIIKEKINNSFLKNDTEIYITKGVNDAFQFVKKTCAENKKQTLRFISCGGDGTLNEVFNGTIGYKNAEVSCYPCGSGNDFVKYFDNVDRFFNLDGYKNADVIDVDLMKVKDRYSNNVVNFGFDTTVAITVNDARDKYGHAGKQYYTKGIIKAIIKSMKNNFKVYADGELLNPSGIALLCTLANGKYVGGSFKCAPKALLDDGLIEVCLVNPMSRIKLVSLIGCYTRGEHLDNDKFKDVVVYRQAKKVEVIAPEGFAYTLDGEIIYDTHFTVEIVKKEARFVVPNVI